MFQLISLCVTRLLFWKVKCSKSRVGRGNTPTSTARDRLTNDLTMMTVATQDPINMGNSASTTTTVMTTSINAVMTRTSTRTTRVDIKSHYGGNGSGSGGQLPKKDISQVECFKCKKLGHYS